MRFYMCVYVCAYVVEYFDIFGQLWKCLNNVLA